MIWFMRCMAIGAVVALTGCDRPTSLERTASRLRPGMSKTSIAELFTEFDRSPGASFEQGLGLLTAAFQTNVETGTLVSYSPKTKGFFEPGEVCSVYFDTNDVIIGFNYLRDDGRASGAKPRN
jgi:hypothetical protein